MWQDNYTLILNTRNAGADGLSLFNLRTEESKPLTTLDHKPGHDIHFPLRLYVPRPSSQNYDTHPDGKSFLMIKEIEDQEQAPIAELFVVENWVQELKRLVPTGKD